MKTLTLSLMLVALASFAGPAHAAVASCTGMPDGTPCADGDACTTDDRCRNETCYAGPDICTDGGVPTALPVTIPAGCLPIDEPDGGVNAKSRVAGGGGCSVTGHASDGGLGVLMVAAMGLGALFRRRKLAPA